MSCSVPERGSGWPPKLPEQAIVRALSAGNGRSHVVGSPSHQSGTEAATQHRRNFTGPAAAVKAPRVSRGGQARRNDDGRGSPAGGMW
jgi:hypothetical protein